MKRFQFFLVAHPLQGLGETLLVGLALLNAAAHLEGYAERFVFQTAVFFLCGLCGMWAVLRIRLPRLNWETANSVGTGCGAWSKPDHAVSAALAGRTVRVGCPLAAVKLGRISKCYCAGLHRHRLCVHPCLPALGIEMEPHAPRAHVVVVDARPPDRGGFLCPAGVRCWCFW